MKQILKAIFILTFAINVETNSQWSTSTYAESALYVCPGFNQNMVTFNDGSSIICGTLSDSRWLQKLDPYGNKVWSQPIQVFNTPGTNYSSGTYIICDNDGGAVLVWFDFRDATMGQFGYVNSAQFMQWVDKNGGKKWMEGGIRLSTVENGHKATGGVFDGKDGILLYMKEYDFLGVNPIKKERSWVRRYSYEGEILWQKNIDSSNIENQVYAHTPIKLGSRIAIYTMSGLKFIDPITGEFEPPPSQIPRGIIYVVNDSAAFCIEGKGSEFDSLGVYRYKYGVTRIDHRWDSIWYSEYKITNEQDNGEMGGPNFPWIFDQDDGVFTAWSYFDAEGAPTSRIQWITKNGVKWGPDGIRISNRVVSALFNGKKKVGLYYGNGTAQLIDSNGTMQWDSSYVVIRNPGDAYGSSVSTDFNGGAILAYWTVQGGILAQHTGRIGKVGVITKINELEKIPRQFVLLQNYPNPFNPLTTISFSIPFRTQVRLVIYDIIGREIGYLIDEILDIGSYKVTWGAANCASGVYFYSIRVNDKSMTKKMILLR